MKVVPRALLASAIAASAFLGRLGPPRDARAAGADDAVHAPPAERGLRVGLRAGVGAPLGKLADDVDFADYVIVQVPFWLDVGYRLWRRVYVGAFVSAGITTLADPCPRTFVCAASIYRVGANAHVHLLPDAAVDPWIGIGAGYEMLDITISGGGIDGTANASGMELFDVQLGADFFATPSTRVGPFLAFTFSEYSRTSTNGRANEGFVQRLHVWSILGVRVAFDL